MRDIEANRYYVDAASSVVDLSLRAKNDAAVKPLRDFLRAVSARADRFVAAGDRQAAFCALQWLQAWAEAGALLGHMSSNQAEYERKWMLAGLAIAYLKIKPEADSARREKIEPWLILLADAVRRFAEASGRTRNNHYYWAGLAVGAVGAATASPSHWEFARRAFHDACADIRPDGTLPLELARQSRALWYHNFALAPLVILAEIAALRGENWYVVNDGALHRLAARTLEGIANPSRLTGLGQDGVDRLSGDVLGWIEFYARRFPDKDLARLLDRRRVYIILGGDMAELARHWQGKTR